ncbi:MAG: nucleotidyltransferase domain-containing protein [Waddliaceae bacterium]
MSRKLLNESISLIIDRFPDVMGIYLFGSYGTLNETKTSDLDLAILFKKSPNNVELWNFSQEIASLINREVDLVDLNRASLVFQFQVLTTGKRVYCKDENACEQFEGKVWPMYIRFNEERKDILDDLNKRYTT